MATDEAFASQGQLPGTVDVELHAPLMATVFLYGECDLRTAPELEDALALTRGSRTLIDMSECEFIDSTIIGILASAQQNLDARSGRLAVLIPSAASSAVKRVFDLMCLRDVLAVYESAAEARKALKA